jgi:hypothetical protein
VKNTKNDDVNTIANATVFIWSVVLLFLAAVVSIAVLSIISKFPITFLRKNTLTLARNGLLIGRLWFDPNLMALTVVEVAPAVASPVTLNTITNFAGELRMGNHLTTLMRGIGLYQTLVVCLAVLRLRTNLCAIKCECVAPMIKPFVTLMRNIIANCGRARKPLRRRNWQLGSQPGLTQFQTKFPL